MQLGTRNFVGQGPLYRAFQGPQEVNSGRPSSRVPETAEPGTARPERENRAHADQVESSARFEREVGRVSLYGAILGGTVGGALASAIRGTSWPVAIALSLSGALVGACVAEEQLRFKLGLPVEIPPAYR